MTSKHRVVFLTGTRADYGKLKPLALRLVEHPEFDVHIFATGMHVLHKYGATARAVMREFGNVHLYNNQTSASGMDVVLSNTIYGFSNYISQLETDMIIVHGDRPETLAGAIVGSFNNILVAHIEGGEVSGTIDELIRHSVSKLSHLHFVANDDARGRLIQLGEIPSNIYSIADRNPVFYGSDSGLVANSSQAFRNCRASNCDGCIVSPRCCSQFGVVSLRIS